MSSTDGLRELTNEISSLLSEGTIRLAPQENGPQSPGYHDNSIPTLVPPTVLVDTVHKPLPLTTGTYTSTTPAPFTSKYTPSQHNKSPNDILTTSLPQLTIASVTTGALNTGQSTDNGSSGLSITIPQVSIDSHNDHHTPPISLKSSLRASNGQFPPRASNKGGLEQLPPAPVTTPVFTVNGVESGLSSVNSSHSASRSSLSNLQLLGESVTSGQDLEARIKAHAQTVDILVGEKTALRGEITTLRAQLSSKSNECSDLHVQLKKLHQKIEEQQRERTVLSDELSRATKALTQSREETLQANKSLVKLKRSLEDEQQINTELTAKVTAQSAELCSLRTAVTDMKGKLSMAELLQQQLSGGSMAEATPPPLDLSSRVKELEGETDRLHSDARQLTLERDRAYSDLKALRESLVEQHETQAKKLTEVERQLAESEERAESLQKQLTSSREESDCLREQVSTEHAQIVDSNKIAIETAQHEKEELQKQLDNLLQENSGLSKLAEEQEDRVAELELQLSRIQEESVDQQSLLTTMAQDREAVSRAMSQNKELKTQIVELQDAFVRMSQQNMELASELDSERLRVAKLKTNPPVEGNPPIEEGNPLPPVGSLPTEGNTNTILLEGNSPPIPKAEQGEHTSSEDQTKQLQDLLLENTKLSDQFNRLQAERSGLSDQFNQLQAERTELLDQFDQLQAERNKLSDQFNLLQAERTELLDRFNQLQVDHSILTEQLSQLQASHVKLSEEHETTLQELETRQLSSKEQTDAGELAAPKLTDVHNMSADELSLLQHNFSALQAKFVRLMTEKAELLEKLQENEHLIEELSYETETIGDYITLYQAQRDVLRNRFQEKDRCIEQLTQEKASMQAKLLELQGLVRQVLSDQSSLSSIPVSNRHPPSVPHTTLTASTPSQPHSSTSLPLHLRPQRLPSSNDEHHLKSSEEEQLVERTSDDGNITMDQSHRTLDASHMTEDISHMTLGESQVTIDGDSLVSTATAEQILHLLDELDFDKQPVVIIPCRLCVGPVIQV